RCRALALLLKTLLGALRLACLVAIAAALPDGLVLLSALRLVPSDLLAHLPLAAAALSQAFVSLRPLLCSGRLLAAACARLRSPACRYPFASGCAAGALRHSAARLAVLGRAAAHSAAGANGSAASAATFTHALCRCQTD